MLTAAAAAAAAAASAWYAHTQSLARTLQHWVIKYKRNEERERERERKEITTFDWNELIKTNKKEDHDDDVGRKEEEKEEEGGEHEEEWESMIICDKAETLRNALQFKWDKKKMNIRETRKIIFKKKKKGKGK